MSILMSTTSQTPHSIQCVVEVRPDFGVPITLQRSGGMTGKVPVIRDGKILIRTAAKIRG